MPDQEDYKKLLTELIQKHMVVLGPNIALDKARKVAELTVADDGGVLQLAGDPPMVLKSIVHEYTALSGQITKQAIEELLKKYPSLKLL